MENKIQMKMSTLFRYTYCLMLVFTFACKKKKETLPEQENNPVIPSETTPTKVDGYLNTSCSFYLTPNDSVEFTYAFSVARFYKQSQYIDSLINLVPDADVGNVLLNNKNLMKETIGSWISYKYLPSPAEFEQYRKPMTWTISGNETYKEMQFAQDLPVPEYEKTFPFPDSIFKYKDNTFKIGSYKNVDEISIYLRSTRSPAITGEKIIKSSQTEITFTNTDFIGFSPLEQHDYLVVVLKLRKTSYKKVEGKTFQVNYFVEYESYMIPYRAY